MTHKASGQAPFTQDDVSALVARLSQFGRQLPAAQRVALRALLERARPREDVRGYTQFEDEYDDLGNYLRTDLFTDQGLYQGWDTYGPGSS